MPEACAGPWQDRGALGEVVLAAEKMLHLSSPVAPCL